MRIIRITFHVDISQLCVGGGGAAYSFCALWELVLLFHSSHFCLTSTTPFHFSQMDAVLNSHATGERQTMNHQTKTQL